MLEDLFDIGSVRRTRLDSPQWYDIVHFEHNLSWFCFGLPQKASFQWS